MKLGVLVRKAREKQGLSIVDLAEQVGVHGSHLSRIEKNDRTRQPSARLLERLSSALSLDVDEVFVAAGRIPVDLERWILKNPAVIVKLREQMERAA